MSARSTRRRFLAQVGAAAVGALVPWRKAGGTVGQEPRRARVIIARDEALAKGDLGAQRDRLARLLDAALQKLADAPDAPSAWRRYFKPNERVGLKVNALGHPTSPAVAEAIAAGLSQAGIRPENVIIWDRFDVELGNAGYKLNRSGGGVRCYGTDADRIGRGYQQEVQKQGAIGSCYSRILADQIDALISVPVLKDHNLAGVSLGMKNFYGAIHNPNKYHENNCDPFVADVVSHPYIRTRWRLTICDATVAQYNAGPGKHPGFAWPLGALIVSDDFVAADAVAADLLEQKRKEAGLKSLAEENRPARHIATAGARGLGVADLSRIERIEV